MDVFAETKYTGNQLAVLKQKRTYQVMKCKNSQGNQFSETTFILGNRETAGTMSESSPRKRNSVCRTSNAGHSVYH
ncbi:hypothetical protein PO124_33440 [Bacillus licheniformis]|nr:hypothetical protein [Bacillus licheniformis]